MPEVLRELRALRCVLAVPIAAAGMKWRGKASGWGVDPADIEPQRQKAARAVLCSAAQV